MNSQARGELGGREAKSHDQEDTYGADMENINYLLLKALTVGQNWKEMVNTVDQSLCP